MDLQIKQSANRRKAFLEENARKANYNATELAKLSCVSLRQLQRYFKEDFGCSPSEWLAEKRVVDARALLMEAESVKEVAYQVGFKQPSHFCREFKRWFGTTPSEFCGRKTPYDDGVDS